MNVWIDVDNAPHVLIFRPIIERLKAQGASVTVTARGRTYVPEMLQIAGIPHTVIGRGQPDGMGAKSAALASRALRLIGFAAGRRFDVAVGHASRSLPPAARLLGVPNLTMFDYEHVSTWIFHRFCDRILVPRSVLGSANGPGRGARWMPFDGFKEEIYLAGFVPDRNIRQSLGIAENEVLVVVRPPCRTAHYHDKRSEAILEALLSRIAGAPGIRGVWVRRDSSDPIPAAARASNMLVPDRPLDGPSLLAAADLAVSGGGTMNREAALLGTPAYSIFTGPLGLLDAELVRSGRLFMIGDPADIARIRLERKPQGDGPRLQPRLREFVIEQIVATAQRQ